MKHEAEENEDSDPEEEQDEDHRRSSRSHLNDQVHPPPTPHSSSAVEFLEVLSHLVHHVLLPLHLYRYQTAAWGVTYSRKAKFFPRFDKRRISLIDSCCLGTERVTGTEDDDIEYDGELEIHHDIPKPNISKLYSSLLHKQQDPSHDKASPTVEVTNGTTVSQEESPIENKPRSRSSSGSSISELSNPSTLKTPSKRALSTTARFQRFVTSKMASTTTGQEIITQALSEEAQMIIHWLIAAVKKCN